MKWSRDHVLTSDLNAGTYGLWHGLWQMQCWMIDEHKLEHSRSNSNKTNQLCNFFKVIFKLHKYFWNGRARRVQNSVCTRRTQGARGEPRACEDNPGCARNPQGARGEPRVREESPGCARRTQGTRGEPRVREENPGCARRTQGARGESRVREESPGCARIVFTQMSRPVCRRGVRQNHWLLTSCPCVSFLLSLAGGSSAVDESVSSDVFTSFSERSSE
jgi:hypothetical protein